MNSSVGHAVAKKLNRDLKTLALFIDLYCRSCHTEAVKSTVCLKTHDLQALLGRKLTLCDDCRKLLTHAFVKRSHCPLDPKPACKHCPSHCYNPAYRQRMRQVMKFSGWKMLLGGRLNYLFHLLF
jgi:predicted amidophosphoribosyltransferase